MMCRVFTLPRVSQRTKTTARRGLNVKGCNCMIREGAPDCRKNKAHLENGTVNVPQPSQNNYVWS